MTVIWVVPVGVPEIVFDGEDGGVEVPPPQPACSSKKPQASDPTMRRRRPFPLHTVRVSSSPNAGVVSHAGIGVTR